MMKTKFAAAVVVGLLFSGTACARHGGDKGSPSQNIAAPQNAVASQAPRIFEAPQEPGTKATCPVTGEQFTINSDTKHAEYSGKYAYFCCAGCKSQFDKDPERYLK
jgi:YHS domain-containing protein